MGASLSTGLAWLHTMVPSSSQAGPWTPYLTGSQTSPTKGLSTHAQGLHREPTPMLSRTVPNPNSRGFRELQGRVWGPPSCQGQAPAWGPHSAVLYLCC